MSLRSRHRLNLALLAVVVALATFAYLKPAGQPGREGQPLLGFSTVSMQDIHIDQADKPGIELKREGKGWLMAAPRVFGADPLLVQGLLDALDAARAVPVQGASPDLSRYGLDKPLVRLKLDGRELDVGADEPVNGDRYVLVEGKVMLTDKLILYHLLHDAYWWMDKHLLPAGAQLTALQLPELTLTLDQDKHWQLAPKDDTVSADAIQRLVDDWLQARAMAVAPLEKKPADGEVALQLAGTEQPLRFQILKDPDFLVLARPDLGLEYQFDTSQKDELLGFAKPAPAATTH